MFANRALGSEKDTIEQTKIGALEMVRVNIAPMNNIVPRDAGADDALPVPRRSTISHKVLDGPMGDEILKACEKAGLHRPGLLRQRRPLDATAKKPVRSAGRHEGPEGPRAAVRPVGALGASAMGANATPMPIGEVYTGLKTGLVDAAENNYPSMTRPSLRGRAGTTPRPST